MMPGSAIPKTIEIPVNGAKPRRLTYIGPGCHGWIYRHTEEPILYRILSVRKRGGATRPLRQRSDDAPIERRHAIMNWTQNATAVENRPQWLANADKNGLIPPSRSSMLDLDGLGPSFVIEYDTPYKQNLVKIFADPDPSTRMDYMVHVFVGMQQWLDCLGPGIVPLPAEIVFGKDKKAFLMALPPWRLPDSEAVLAAPERALYLPPEYIVGMAPKSMGYNASRYAIGALLMQCFFKSPQADPAELLRRAARGVLWSRNQPSLLAYWQQQISGIREAVTIARRLTDKRPKVRSAVDTFSLGRKLQLWLDQIHPEKALNELVNMGKWEEADQFLQNVLLANDSHDILCLAAEIATKRGRPLEGVQFCENAIESGPANGRAYLQQFQILVADDTRRKLQPLLDKRPDLGRRIDKQIDRDFRNLQPYWRTDDCMASFAKHMLWRRQIPQAVRFLKGALMAQQIIVTDDALSKLRLPLQQLYIEALILDKNYPQARQAVANLRKVTGSLFEQGQLAPEIVKLVGKICRKMELRITRLETETRMKKKELK